MPNFSDYTESGILNFLFRANTNAFAAPTNVSVALCSNVPLESHNGTSMPELAAVGAYARVNLGAPSNSVWSEVSQNTNSGTISNSSTITFPTATLDWGYVSGVALTTNSNVGQGQVLVFGALTTPRLVLSGDTFRFNASDISLFLG
jgi:hypothetical protein